MKFALPKKSSLIPIAEKTAAKRGVTLLSYWLHALIGIALVVALVFGGLIYLEQTRQQRLSNAEVARQVDALSQQISQTLNLYHRLLQGLSKDPVLRGAFARNDQATLKRREATWTHNLPDVLRVRLLPPGHDLPDRKATPAFSFAAIQMLRLAEKGPDTPPLELHQALSEDAHVAGVAAIRDEQGQVLGLLHVAIDPRPLKRWLNNLGALPGRVEIQQKVAGGNAALYTSEQAIEVGRRVPDGVRPLAGSLLRVAYWNGPAPMLDAGIAFPLMLAAGLILGLGVAILLFQYARLRKDLDVDQAELVQLAEQLLAGEKGSGRASVRVRDFGYVRELLVQRLRDAREMVGEASSAQPSVAAPADGSVAPSRTEAGELPDSLFRSQDIHGLVASELTAGVVRELGRAIGSHAYEEGQQSVIVARDTRESGAELSEALIAGLCATGRDVIDMGVVPIPVVYFATHFLGSKIAVMVSGGSAPDDYNGLSVIVGGEAMTGPRLLGLRERVLRGDLLEGAGVSQPQDLLPDYIERIADDVSIARPLKVVLDCGSGSASLAASGLFRALGCEVVELYCQVDNRFPGHYPDPSRQENLQDLQQQVLATQADLGLAFDVDGNRLGVVDSQGAIIWPDRLMMLLSADALSRHPGGDVIFDVKCSRALASQILQNGGRPVMWKSGAALLKAKLRETGALMAGEWCGRIMFRERWYGFDDAMYAGARLLEILSVDPRESAEVFADYPEFVSMPETFLKLRDGEPFAILEQAKQQVDLLGGAKLTDIDGLRAELEDGWGLMHASHDAPLLSFRFEADTEQGLQRIQGLYRDLMASVAPDKPLPF